MLVERLHPMSKKLIINVNYLINVNLKPKILRTLTGKLVNDRKVLWRNAIRSVTNDDAWPLGSTKSQS